MFRTTALAAGLLAALALIAPARADDTTEPPDLVVQVQEITYQVNDNGQARPIDHKILGVYGQNFEDQYGSSDHEAEGVSFGSVYFEVPRGPDEEPNYNIYLYLREGDSETVCDGYLNNGVDGALFKLTTMLMRRAPGRAYVRLMHAIVPPAAGASKELLARKVNQELHEKVARLLARR
jgi:hypothetical protein